MQHACTNVAQWCAPFQPLPTLIHTWLPACTLHFRSGRPHATKPSSLLSSCTCQHPLKGACYRHILTYGLGDPLKHTGGISQQIAHGPEPLLCHKQLQRHTALPRRAAQMRPHMAMHAAQPQHPAHTRRCRPIKLQASLLHAVDACAQAW